MTEVVAFSLQLALEVSSFRSPNSENLIILTPKAIRNPLWAFGVFGQVPGVNFISISLKFSV